MSLASRLHNMQSARVVPWRKIFSSIEPSADLELCDLGESRLLLAIH